MIKSIRRFFLICSGATLSVLERPECETELTRYAMMGAFVALTAAFAALSGGYALYKGFKMLVLAIPVGLLWGGFIFTLDRFIVSSIRKKPLGDHLSSTERAMIKLGEIGAALPRLILATFIAMTVAVPLEMKYFEPEIDAQIQKTNIDAANQVAAKAPQGIPEIAALEKEIQDMESTEKTLRERRDLLRDQLFNEANGVKGQGYTGIPGEGPQFEKRRQEYKRIDEELKETLSKNTPRKERVRNRLDELRLELGQDIKQATGVMKQGDGFLARYRALSQLAADGPVERMSLFLVILLTLIETAPVLIKLFAGRGPYDDALEAVEHKIHIAKQKEISDFNSDVNTELEIYRTKCQVHRQREERRIQDLTAPGHAEPRVSTRRPYPDGKDEGEYWGLEMEAAAKDQITHSERN